MFSKTQYENGIEFDYKLLGQRGGWIINESGFYSLVLSSKMPEAKKFKKWVTSEVLPQIRKTGGYLPIVSEESEEELMARALEVAHKTLALREERLKKQEEIIVHQQKEIAVVNFERNMMMDVNDRLEQHAVKLERENEKLIEEVDYLRSTIDISGLSDSIKRELITNVIKHNSNDGRYKERWQLLYDTLKNEYGINAETLKSAYIRKTKCKSNISKLDVLIAKGHIDDLLLCAKELWCSDFIYELEDIMTLIDEDYFDN